MSKRATFVIALTIVVALAPRVYVMVEAAINTFPMPEGVIQFVDLEFAWWFRAPFIAAHACVAWLVVLMWRGSATVSHKILTLMLLGEMTAMYLSVLRFWNNGVEVTLY
jgi:hypothetical protein